MRSNCSAGERCSNRSISAANSFDASLYLLLSLPETLPLGIGLNEQPSKPSLVKVMVGRQGFNHPSFVHEEEANGITE